MASEVAPLAGYDVTLVSINVNLGGFGITSVYQGFPSDPTGYPFTNGNFNTLLYSQWMCGATGGVGPYPVGIGPAFTGFFGLKITGGGTITLSSWNSTASEHNTYSGTFASPAPTVRHHILCSVNAGVQVIQLYIDDQPVVITGSWTAPPGSTPFNLAFQSSVYWEWDVEGTIPSGIYPGVADIWCANLAGDTFVDLSLVANRRKFINADLTPVDLGSNGQNPFGTPPQIYCRVPAGDLNPADFLINRGSGGTNFNLSSGYTITFQTAGTCTLPPPPVGPPPSGPSSGLRMGDMLVTDQTIIPGSNHIFLEWSDDRGHSYGSPVGQIMGPTGKYFQSVQWQRLGVGRDRVFRVSFSVPTATALQGAWVEVTSADT